MRHRKNARRLSRQSAHRKAVVRNQVKSFLVKERITTTVTLAKESRRIAERLITLGKQNTLAARRRAFRVLGDRDIVRLLFAELAPRFMNRSGGYTRIVHADTRRGDSAACAILELVERKKEEKKHKKGKKTAPVKETKKQPPQKKEPTDKTEKQKKAEEQAAADDKEMKKTGPEDKRKGFLGGLRKFLKHDKTE